MDLSAHADIATISRQGDLAAMGRRQFQKPNVFRTEGKNPQWYFRARVNALDGTRPPKRYYLGECSEMTKRQAEKQRDEILIQEAINEPTVRIMAQVKFTEAIAAYRQTIMPTLREITARTYSCVIEKHIEPSFATLRMCDIDYRVVQNWVNGLEVSASSKGLCLAVFNSIWRGARRMKYTRDACPGEDVMITGKRTVRRQRILSWDDWRKLRSALPADHQALAEVVMFTGMRISEALGLCWEHLDFAHTTIRIEQRRDQLGHIGDTKTQAGRRPLPMGPLVDLLRSMQTKATSEFVFDGLEYSKAHYELHEAAVRVGLYFVGFGFHTLRRSYNTWLRNNVGAAVAKAQLGHTSIRTNDTYLILGEDGLQQQEEAMRKAYAEAMGPEQKGKVQ